METKALTPASREALARVVAQLQVSQQRLQDFVEHTAAAMGIDASRFVFSLERAAFEEKSPEKLDVPEHLRPRGGPMPNNESR